MSNNLDHYIEAQIHGDVSLDEDIAMLVAILVLKGLKSVPP